MLRSRNKSDSGLVTGPRLSVRNLSAPAGLGLIVWLLLAQGPAGIASAQETPPSLRLVSDVWCPYTCESNATQRGILVDIVEEVFSLHGITINYKVVPWERAKHDVEIGKADIALGVSLQSKSSMLKNSIPLTHDETVLIWRKGQGQPYTGPAVLDGKTIGVGYAYSFDMGGEIDQYIALRVKRRDKISSLYQNEHIEPLLKMLRSGRVDVVIEDLGAVQNLITHGGLDLLEDGLNSLDFSATGKTNDLYLGFTPNARGRELLKLFDEGLLQLGATGKISTILKAYRNEGQVHLIPLPEARPEPVDPGVNPASTEQY